MKLRQETRYAMASVHSLAIHHPDCTNWKNLKDPIEVAVKIVPETGRLKVANYHPKIGGDEVWVASCCHWKFARVQTLVYQWSEDG